jgi:hypothetical protein
MPREPGTPAGAAEILARKQLVIGAAEDMSSRARDFLAKGADASPEDTAAFLASIERTSMIQAQFLGARAEAGRALNILKSTARDAERTKLVQKVVDQWGKDPAKLAAMITELDNPASALKFAKEAVKATSWEKIVEAWKAGCSPGPSRTPRTCWATARSWRCARPSTPSPRASACCAAHRRAIASPPPSRSRAVGAIAGLAGRREAWRATCCAPANPWQGRGRATARPSRGRRAR